MPTLPASTSLNSLNSLKNTRPIPKPPIRKPTQKASGGINLHLILTIILGVYAIFSFVWIIMLYTNDGFRVCSGDSFPCNITVPITRQAITSINDKNKTTQELVDQKAAKNYIRNIYQSQTVLNDNLIAKQQDVEKSALDFRNYLQNSIRFINGEPQLLSGFDEADYQNRKIELENQLDNLKQLRNINAQAKIDNKKQIDNIYLSLNERQENSYQNLR
jgi:hypothetical protein